MRVCPLAIIVIVSLKKVLCDFEGSEDCVGGDFVVVHSERAKKEKLRELSVAAGTITTSSSFDYQDCEMGCDHVSDNEDELHLEEEESSLSIIGSSKRFKVPKKVDYL